VFHVELRQFPHSFNAFNVDDAGLWAIVEPWVNDRVFEAGEERWNPRAGTILILEGPHIPVEELSMGRGWPTAVRESEDVTERVLEHARDVAAGMHAEALGVEQGHVEAPVTQSRDRGSDDAASGDALALGVALATLLGADAERLLAAWREVAARAQGLAPSEALALAERELAR
jgi:hypothetical protein